MACDVITANNSEAVNYLKIAKKRDYIMVWCQFYIAEDLSEFKPRFRGDDHIIGIGKFLGDKFFSVKPDIGDYYYKDGKSKRYKTINVVYDHDMSRALGYECYHVQLLRDFSYSK